MSEDVPVVLVKPVCERDLDNVEGQLRDTDRWKVSDATDKTLDRGQRNLAQSALRKQRERLRFKSYKMAKEE